MPTKRLNISLVDEEIINELKTIRKELQYSTDKEDISFSSIISALIKTYNDLEDGILIKALKI